MGKGGSKKGRGPGKGKVESPSARGGRAAHDRSWKKRRGLLQAKAVELLGRGASYEEIAEDLGIAVGTAHKYVAEELARLQGEGRAMLERRRGEQRLQIDLGLGRVIGLLTKVDLRIREARESGTMELEDFEAVSKLTTALVKLQERASKLDGLDAPEKLKLEGAGLGVVPHAELVRRARGAGGVAGG